MTQQQIRKLTPFLQASLQYAKSSFTCVRAIWEKKKNKKTKPKQEPGASL